MKGHNQLDPCIWRDHSNEVVDKDCSPMEVPDVGGLPADQLPYMVVLLWLVLVKL